MGLQGLWQESMDTLALTLVRGAASALLFGIPLGVWAGLSDRVNRIVTPVLDFMQTMPTFVYLAPLTLFFLIGAGLRHDRHRDLRGAAGRSGSPRTASARCRRRRVEAAESLGRDPVADAAEGAAADGQADHRDRASTRPSWPRCPW